MAWAMAIVQGINLPADWVWMRKQCILPCPLGDLFQVPIGTEDAERADAHEGAVGLTLAV